MMSTLTDLAETTFALSPEQRAMLSMADEDPGAASLTLEIRTCIEGPLDPQRLRAAVESALRSHGALSTALRAVPGYRGLRQQPLESLPALDWHAGDLRAPAAERAAPASVTALEDWWKGVSALPLDPSRAAVLRVGLARTAHAQHRLVIAANALAADQGSLVALLDQVVRAYGGDSPHGGDEPFQYAQFVEWRQDLQEGDDARQGQTYWRNHMEGSDALPPPRLDALMDGPAAVSGRRLALRHAQAVEPVLAAQVQAAADSAGTQVHTLLQAV